MSSDYNGTPGTLHISGYGDPLTYQEIVTKILLSNKVSATVSASTKTIVRTAQDTTTVNDVYTVESGCTIQIHGLRPKLYAERLWEPLKSALGLHCAFLQIPGRYSGCILNFIRSSACNCTQII